ncbi:DNA polymerase III subunit epsilon [Sphingomonas sp. LB2R24]|uniref:DNA polymerase III subunit epsilon n=1 Tax=Sphingomonas sorbitolis TaxID=3096165 RepID=UPI002FCB33AC
MQDPKTDYSQDLSEFPTVAELKLVSGPTGDGDARGPYVGVALGATTIGLAPEDGAIMDLSIRRFRYDEAGHITDIDEPYAWLEHPGRPVPADLMARTGLTEAHLEGQSIDDEAAATLLRSASFITAHHARLQRRWVEHRLEGARGLNWACSHDQIDWQAHGYVGDGLGLLLAQSGHLHGGHRVGTDVDAVIQLLRTPFDDGRTALKELIGKASRRTWIIRAVGADATAADMLRRRGYFWDAEEEEWCREVGDGGRVGEEFWLAGHVYDMAMNPKAIGPSLHRVTAATRFL